jgi:uncharacterized protein YndB with AHSA1/START domain
MQQASARQTIAAPIARVWALVSDVTTVERWHPAVRTADLLSASRVGVGATRRCNFYDGSSVREEVVEAEEGARVRLRITEFSAPLNVLEAELVLVPVADGSAQVDFILHFEVKWGPLGRLMGALMVQREMAKVAARALAGLAHHAETGALVGQDFHAAA